MSNRVIGALAFLFVGSAALVLEAQEAPRERTSVTARFQLEHLSTGQVKDDATIFDTETGRIYVVDDLESVRTIDPVAGTATMRSMRCVEREAAVRAVVAAIHAKDVAALRPRMTRALLVRHPDVESWILEVEADLGQSGVDARLRKARFRFEDDAWRLDL